MILSNPHQSRTVESGHAPHASAAAASAAGTVLLDPAGTPRPTHEQASHQAIARQLAWLQQMTFGGVHRPGERPAGPLYFVPEDVLLASSASELGIAGEQDLFGGVVTHPIMASKAITHPLVEAEALRPAYWWDAFAQRVQNVTLPGYSAFTHADARLAGLRLLQDGAVRVKPTDATAGRGQGVARDEAELDALLEAFDDTRLAHCGLVLESNLAEVTTYSVGHVRVGEMQIAYYGTQQLTRDNTGASVYGGSELCVRRGDLDDLLREELPDPVRTAISQAKAYDDAARACFPGMFASRRNYDVAQGTDPRGHRRSGVLEPSWRIGGASGAELAALCHFHEHPQSRWLRASTIERYGRCELPADATVLFDGIDPEVGPLTKFARVEADGHT